MDSDSRNDRIPVLKEQVTRIYMTTVAANEREERILTKKLDALDLEHRAQYLRMKKRILDTTARQNSRKKLLLEIDKDRLTKTATNCNSNDRPGDLQLQHVSHVVRETTTDKEHDVTTTATVSASEDQRETSANNARKETTVKHDVPLAAAKKDSEIVKNKCETVSKDSDTITDEFRLKNEQRHHRKEKRIVQNNKNMNSEQIKLEDSRDLADRLKYTESEVKRLKTSWQGQRSPKLGGKRRTFLPHLAQDDSVGTIKVLSQRHSQSEDQDSDLALKFPDINKTKIKRHPRDPKMKHLKHSKTIATIKEMDELGTIATDRKRTGRGGRTNSDPLPIVSSNK